MAAPQQVLPENQRINILDSECDAKEIKFRGKQETRPFSRSNIFTIRMNSAAAFFAILFMFFGLKAWLQHGITGTISLSRCDKLAVRKEWRTLSRYEKQGYIEAVKCITKKASRLSSDQTLHDDFSIIHNNNGNYSHDAAPFLAWHRYYIHFWETVLRTECQYDGPLAYWDWTFDWMSLMSSPVFSPVDGFGGSGNKSTLPQIPDGYCVTDGPFANLVVQYYGEERNPHCLSRDIEDTCAYAMPECEQEIRPEAIEKLLSAPTYQDFVSILENGAHKVIPSALKGDWLRFTTPNDPLFYLHHAQVDRLWDLWQRNDPSIRLREFSGIARADSNNSASLDDILDYGDFTPTMSVREIMDTHDSPLCYFYE